MNLIQMSVTAGILIAGITAFRFLFNNRVSRRVMVLLWEIAIVRLIFPFWLPLPFRGIGDLATATVSEEKVEIMQVTVSDVGPELMGWQITLGAGGKGLDREESFCVTEDTAVAEEAGTGRILWAVYALAASAMTAGSLYRYMRDRQQFREGLPMPEREKALLLGMLEEKEAERLGRVRFCISDRTASPVTCGIFRPAIVFPKGISHSTQQEVVFWLRHELVHIRHHDNLKKIIARGVLCLHWFNPPVWAMYVFFNRDMEILCDETVVRSRRESRKDYALALLSMAEKRSLGFQTGMGFGKNAVTERITAVMKLKRMNALTTLAAVAAVTAALTALGSHSVSFAAGVSGATEWAQVPGGEETQDYQITVTADFQEATTAEAVVDSAYVVESDTSSTAAETSVAEESSAMAQGGGQTQETGIAQIMEEYRELGISVTVSGDDYQLYYEGEPVFFFADNRIPEEEGFSGRLFLRPASRRNGMTGVVTVCGSDGKISGVRHLSREESEAYADRWR